MRRIQHKIDRPLVGAHRTGDTATRAAAYPRLGQTAGSYLTEDITSGGDPPGRASALPALIAGANLWFVAVAFPWLFIDQPSVQQSVVHALPLAVLLIGTSILQWADPATLLHTRTRLLLAGGMPLTVGLATALRAEEVNRLALPGWALLLCAVSLWVFVGALGTVGATPPPPGTPQPSVGTASRLSSTLVQIITVLAAAITVTLAPQWAASAEHNAASPDTTAGGALLTTAAGTALAVGMLLIVLGPSGVTATAPVGSSLRQRLLPLMLMAAVGGATYALTTAVR